MKIGNYLYLITDYYKDYTTLTTHLHLNEALDEKLKKIIIKNLTTGLKVMHKHGIIHGDIKPDNILVSNKGDVKYIDFGISCMEKHMDDCRVLSGAPQYMLPKLLKMKNEGFQPKLTKKQIIKIKSDSDKYALSVIINSLKNI